MSPHESGVRSDDGIHLPAGWASALGRVAAGLATATSTTLALETVAANCAVLGRVGWVLLLADVDDRHLYCSAMAGLDRGWAPPLRPLTTETWPASSAARGTAEYGGPGSSPYPVDTDTPSFAWAALPLHRTPGSLVAVRPDGRRFDAAERYLIDLVAEHMGACTARLTRDQAQQATEITPSVRRLDWGAFTLDLRSRTLECDATFARLHGLPPAEVIALDDLLALVPPKDLARSEQALATIASRHGTYEVSYRITAPGGGYRYLESRGSTVPGADGTVLALVGHASDVTREREDRRHQERSMSRLLNRSDSMLALASAAAHASTTGQLTDAATQAVTAFNAESLTIAEGRRGRLHVVAAHGQPPENRAATEGLDLRAATPLTDSVREQRPIFCPSPEALVAAYPHFAGVVERIGTRAWAALPMSTAGDPPAGCLLSFATSDGFGPDDQALFIAAASLLGRALDRHRAFQKEQSRALELQRGLLPPQLPRRPGLDLAAEYHPAASGAQVGGDWYDAFPFPDGTLALVIGDVQGHSMGAASLMGRLRATMRAYAMQGCSPARILTLTNRLLAGSNDEDLDSALLATCCVLRVDVRRRTAAMAIAGHPPPLLHAPGRTPRALTPPAGPPLGVDSGARYPASRRTLPRGSDLLLYTDGLTDRPGVDPDEAMSGLAKSLADAPAGPAAPALERIFAASRPDVPYDDIAVLLARFPDGESGGRGHAD